MKQFNITIDMNELFPLQLYEELFGKQNIDYFLHIYYKFYKNDLEDALNKCLAFTRTSLLDCEILLSYGVIHFDSSSDLHNYSLYDKRQPDKLNANYIDNYYDKDYNFYKSNDTLPLFLQRLINEDIISFIKIMVDKLKNNYWNLKEQDKIPTSKYWNFMALFRE